jgi:hypothetical protein
MIELQNIYDEIWEMLVDGADKSKHDFHLPMVSTVNENSPDVRTVVLRRVIQNERLLIHHTDLRSEKIKHIKKNKKVCWLFYSKELKTQLRVYGDAKIHTDDKLADEQWESSQVLSRRCYLTEPAPGTECETVHNGIPDNYRVTLPTPDETEIGRKNFAVISCKVKSIDWLHLKSTGHSRAKFEIENDQIKSSWIVP